MSWFWLLIPVISAVLHRRFRVYPFSPVVTLSCAAIALGCGCPVLSLGLCFSAAGDWFLHHERGRDAFFLCGVAGFFLGHCCFAAHSVVSGGFSLTSLPVFAVLFCGVAVFLLRRVWRGIDPVLRTAVVMYAGISCFSLASALFSGFSALPRAVFSLGIAMILFSDCIIALSRFGHVKKIGALIMPTYFACHIFVSAACILEAV